MNKFSVDYSSLQQNLNREKCFRLKDVEHRLQKVAFDVVRFIDSDNIDGLWQIRKDDNGEYIVAMYGDGEASPVSKVSSKVVTASSDWSVIKNASGEQLNIFYKGTPVTKVSPSLSKEDISLMCSYLPHKLATTPTLVSILLNDLPFEQKRNLLDEHPELSQVTSSKK